MKNFLKVLIINVFIVGILYFIFYSLMPQKILTNTELSNFSTHRALKIVKNISAKPHYIGSVDHDLVANYVFNELKKLGLEASVQEGFSMTEWGTLTKSKNIIAKIKGSNTKTSNGKALLLLSHYDSAPHSFSHGAADDASGIATIIEGVRAFLHNKTKHKNDIIILFTDAEELGLNGAALFVTKHQWAKKIGLAINFEARGTAGPSYMLMESNRGNAALISAFSKSNPNFIAANSLMYSIYKMLPNDTYLTVFRENGNIQGFNFAFIDNHFNYHTAQDDLAHLDPKSIEHNGGYLMPMLKYFSNTNLNKLTTTQDFVYFNAPFTFFYYPFDWVLPLWIFAISLFIGFTYFGIAKKVLSPSEIGKGFLWFFASIFFVGIITFVGWKTILLIYPEYNEILHGFTYNGHNYMMFFSLISIAICFYIYEKLSDKTTTMNNFIAPMFVWIIINLIIAIKLKGAGFFIIPVFFGLIILGYYVFTEKTNLILNLILSIPALIIFVPFIAMFPVGLGLKIMFGSSILIALLFTILLPVFNLFTHKRIWIILLLITSFFFLIDAHINSDFEAGKAKPNSLLYVYDLEKNKAFWTTYDTNLDEWTKTYLGDKPQKATELKENQLYSKYNSEFTYSTFAPLISIEKPTIEFISDSVVGNRRFLKIKISPNRKVNRYDIFANRNLNFKNFKANGENKLDKKSSKFDTNERKILSYYVVDNIPLEMEFSIDATKNLEMDLMESSFDLLSNIELKVIKRQAWMMPKPFVLNNAIVLKQHIVPQGLIEQKPIVTDTISK